MREYPLYLTIKIWRKKILTLFSRPLVLVSVSNPTSLTAWRLLKWSPAAMNEEELNSFQIDIFHKTRDNSRQYKTSIVLVFCTRMCMARVQLINSLTIVDHFKIYSCREPTPSFAARALSKYQRRNIRSKINWNVNTHSINTFTNNLEEEKKIVGNSWNSSEIRHWPLNRHFSHSDFGDTYERQAAQNRVRETLLYFSTNPFFELKQSL